MTPPRRTECAVCHAPLPADAGHRRTYCTRACRDRADRVRAQVQGRCQRCRDPVAPGHVLCRDHLIAMRQRARRHYLPASAVRALEAD